jgi:glucose repression regulatory protein TUP1
MCTFALSASAPTAGFWQLALRTNLFVWVFYSSLDRSWWLNELGQIWDIKQKRIVQALDGHSQDIPSLQFSSDNRFIVSGSYDCTVRIWDMMCEPNTPSSIERILQIDEPEVGAGITSVAISSDSRLIAAGSLDTTILIWDAHTGELLEKLCGH